VEIPGQFSVKINIMQQAAVELSNEGRIWLSERLQEAFVRYGTIQQDELGRLDWPKGLPDEML
jgi:hypothetical protein